MQKDNSENRVTIFSIARELGLDPSTVSKALKGAGRVSKITRERVRETADRMGYQRCMIASSLATQRSYTVGVVLPVLGDSVYSQMLQGIESVACLRGYSIIVGCTLSDPKKEQYHYDSLYARHAEGIITAPIIDEVNPAQTIENLVQLEGRGTPIVVLCQNVPDSTVTVVDNNNMQGAKMMTEHLISIGHTRIGYVHVGNCGTSISARERMQGYMSAIIDAGLPLDSSLTACISDDSPENHSSVIELVIQYMNDARKPTAIFAASDMLAIKVIRALSIIGYRVPDDVAVVGYDDIMVAEHTMPALTTVQLPGVEIGVRAAEILFSRIDGSLTNHVHEQVMGRLIVRESCGARKSGLDSPGFADKATDLSLINELSK